MEPFTLSTPIKGEYTEVEITEIKDFGHPAYCVKSIDGNLTFIVYCNNGYWIRQGGHGIPSGDIVGIGLSIERKW